MESFGMKQRKKRSALTTILVVLFVATGLGAVLTYERPEAPAPVAYTVPDVVATVPEKSLVTLRVSGAAFGANLMFTNDTNGTEQLQEVQLPWSRNLRLSPGEHVYLSAQNTGELGDLTVVIEASGNQIASGKASGPYSIATASTSCCG